MDEKTRAELRQLERILQDRHPNWPQEKARWIAEQSLGVRPVARR